MPQSAEGEISSLKGLRYRIEAIGLHAAAAFVPMLPRRVMLALARCLGSLAYYLLREDRRVAHANLDIAFGDSRTRKEKSRLARSAFQTLATTLLGLFWAPRLTQENISDVATMSQESIALAKQIADRKTGSICLTPHYGDWELMSLAAGFWDIKYLMITEPTPNPVLGEIISRLRCLSGHTIVPPRNAVLKLYKALSRGSNVAMLIDVNGRRGRGGVWLDFFGLPVFNSAAVVELALRSGAAIVFGYARPLADGRMELVYGPEVQPVQTGDREADILATNQKCLALCEELVRREPQHWLWTYKRWKRRPSPELGRYPFYSKYDAKT